MSTRSVFDVASVSVRVSEPTSALISFDETCAAPFRVMDALDARCVPASSPFRTYNVKGAPTPAGTVKPSETGEEVPLCRMYVFGPKMLIIGLAVVSTLATTCAPAAPAIVTAIVSVGVTATSFRMICGPLANSVDVTIVVPLSAIDPDVARRTPPASPFTMRSRYLDPVCTVTENCSTLSVCDPLGVVNDRG